MKEYIERINKTKTKEEVDKIVYESTKDINIDGKAWDKIIDKGIRRKMKLEDV